MIVLGKGSITLVLQELVEDDLVHGPGVVLVDLHEQRGGLHCLQLLGFRQIFQPFLLLGVQLVQVLGRHIVYVVVVSDQRVRVDSLLMGVGYSFSELPWVLGV